MTSLQHCHYVWEDDNILCFPGNILKQWRVRPMVSQKSGSCSLSHSATSSQRMCPLIASRQPSCMSRSVYVSVVDHDSSASELAEHTLKLQPYCHTHLTLLHPQFCDDVIFGRFPASPERLLKLAALRMQFLEGDCELGANMWGDIQYDICHVIVMW